MLRFALPTLSLLALVATACGPTSTTEHGERGERSGPGNTAPAQRPGFSFQDIASETGLDFAHVGGLGGQFFMPEIMGAGCAFVDYDNDGDLDVYLVQGAWLSEHGRPADQRAPRDRLFRNELSIATDGTRRITFVDVTDEVAIDDESFGIGVSTGDVDGDGWTDLYVANVGGNRLWRNLGAGPDGVVTFEDITERSGTQDERWTSSAAFADLDRDGDLDLYLANYLDFRLSNHQICPTAAGEPDYCGPVTFEPETDRLLRNRGDGTFEDISLPSGILAARGSGLGVVVTDIDGDRWPDLYVANDKMANFLWLHRGLDQNGLPRFVERALESGVAVNEDGLAEASMGLDAGDFDNDGDEDLVVAHLEGESNTVYVNQGGAWLDDRSIATGLGAPSRPFTAFGLAFADLDGDGWLDLVAANGHVHRLAALAERGDPLPYHQADQVFRNRGDGTFEDVSGASGAPFAESAISRGLAVGDVDNDGDPDLLISRAEGRPALLRNDGVERRWLGLTLLDERGRQAIGAQITLDTGTGSILRRVVRTTSSYGSAHDPRLLLGLGSTRDPSRSDPSQPSRYDVTVLWPRGRTERFPALDIGRYHVLREGLGTTGTEISEPKPSSDAP